MFRVWGWHGLTLSEGLRASVVFELLFPPKVQAVAEGFRLQDLWFQDDDTKLNNGELLRLRLQGRRALVLILQRCPPIRQWSDNKACRFQIAIAVREAHPLLVGLS